ncbi:MAG: hypothetical protein U5K29_03140 [Acidimicrobiales bacterium]|nr:hypothetical protein [Acidimicrobiales bacterium]
MTEVMEQGSGTAARLRPFVVGVAAVVAVALGGSVALAATGGDSVDVSVGPLGSEPGQQDREGPEIDVASDAVTVQEDEVGPPDPLPAENVRPQTGGVPVDPFPDDPCRGPPPFAGQEPESEEAREAEAEAFSEWRNTNCPDDDDDGEGRGSGEGPARRGSVDPFPDDPCRGPPPFAGQEPESEEAREAEAEAFRVQREACEAGDTGSN